ncbi:hypothetical protein ATO8_17380 [Roseivivax marinus]|jgi:Rod binding domain-containing protein|uniref:Flagellar protein FlgJ N-terminal domain-containing protein n=1 Tax=Roseivivax marinus TaxID=1379903 RepID=W4HHK8_9RHOB|nr:rod-binding protein [Roseivivax marinus]ETW11465.1 hypothetical protein ATO8_17380 [Roseivivax marinus]UMA66870.1 rod-binding protein [Roseivivax marinus]
MDIARASSLPQAVQPSSPPPAQGGIDETARSFETVFLSQAVDQMLATVEVGTFGGGHAEEMWRSFLSTAVAESISAQGGTGIARQIVAAYDQAQGMADGKETGQ